MSEPQVPEEIKKQLEEEAKNLNELQEIDSQGKLTTGPHTTEIPGTRANRKAKELGFQVTRKTPEKSNK
jgi:hypothetical protein